MSTWVRTRAAGSAEGVLLLPPCGRHGLCRRVAAVPQGLGYAGRGRSSMASQGLTVGGERHAREKRRRALTPRNSWV